MRRRIVTILGVLGVLGVAARAQADCCETPPFCTQGVSVFYCTNVYFVPVVVGGHCEGAPNCATSDLCQGTCVAPPTATPTDTPVPTETPTATATPMVLSLGDSCTDPGQCSSGFCASGVCCETACTGAVESCNLPGSAGLCRQHSVAPAVSHRGGLFLGIALVAFGGATLRRTLRVRSQ